MVALHVARCEGLFELLVEFDYDEVFAFGVVLQVQAFLVAVVPVLVGGWRWGVGGRVFLEPVVVVEGEGGGGGEEGCEEEEEGGCWSCYYHC